jgi:hypothetical protein
MTDNSDAVTRLSLMWNSVSEVDIQATPNVSKTDYGRYPVDYICPNDRILVTSVRKFRVKGCYLPYCHSFNEGWNITCRPKHCGIWKLCCPININLNISRSRRISSAINYPEHKPGIQGIGDKKKLQKDSGAEQILEDKRGDEKNGDYDKN